MKSLQESLFTNNIKNKIVPEKLAYVLKKFFGNDVALCEDHQGSTKWYEINPLTMNTRYTQNIINRIVLYCKKIDGIEVIEDKIPNFDTIRCYAIGSGDYWIYLSNTFKHPRVSKEFYECGALPQDQTGVAQRGWEEWQRQRL